MGKRVGGTGADIQLVRLSAPVRHALKALSFMSRRPELGLRSTQIARALKLPKAALSKSFQKLAKAGILSARRGPGGGYRLNAGRGKTTLADVARALDVEDSRLGRCVLEDRPCRGEASCALHHAAKEADARLRRELGRLTIADLE